MLYKHSGHAGRQATTSAPKTWKDLQKVKRSSDEFKKMRSIYLLNILLLHLLGLLQIQSPQDCEFHWVNIDFCSALCFYSYKSTIVARIDLVLKYCYIQEI